MGEQTNSFKTRNHKKTCKMKFITGKKFLAIKESNTQLKALKKTLKPRLLHWQSLIIFEGEIMSILYNHNRKQKRMKFLL